LKKSTSISSLGDLAFRDVAQDVDESCRLTGRYVAEEANRRLHPEIGAVLLPATVGDGAGVLAFAALAKHCIDLARVFGVRTFQVVRAEHLFLRPSQQLGSGGRDILALPVEPGEHDHVAGRLGEQAEAHLTGLQAQPHACAPGH
jgi:hypothetical protein